MKEKFAVFLFYTKLSAESTYMSNVASDNHLNAVINGIFVIFPAWVGFL